MKSLTVFLFFIIGVNAYVPTMPFNRWHCIDFEKNIDKSKPFSYNVGDLPLVEIAILRFPLLTIEPK